MATKKETKPRRRTLTYSGPREYQCSNGHLFCYFDGKRVSKCIGYVHGKPCTGSVIRIGEGSDIDRREVS